MLHGRWAMIVVAVTVAFGFARSSSAAASTTVGMDFETDIAPVLLKRCLSCHSGPSPTGKLDLSSRDGLLRGGDGGPAFDAAHPDESLLWEKIESGEMPPAKQGVPQPLPPSEADVLKGWMNAGAPWPTGRVLDLFERTTEARGGRDWWSLQPIGRPKPPSAANPIDAFVLAKLEETGWTYAPPADKRSLLRRVFYDLIGLPPSYEETRAFLDDPSPDAYERVVDRLLASPHYGERWGRRWLDAARYAETSGYERDQTKPNIWRYRDWVVRAFNDDKPYDQFVIEQLAGDEWPERSESSVIATGFIRLGTWNDEPNDPKEYVYDRLEDMVHAASAPFLAMTVKCARCHDHKFDPIRQTDYYRMASAFWAGPIDPGPREWLGGPDPKMTGHPDLTVWTDRGPQPPPLRLLIKGDPNRPGPVVEPDSLSMLPKLAQPDAEPADKAKTTGRRLRLARWIVDPANPLTPRVWVNRIWQGHFGEGLVKSVDNFGFTGDQPSHPELLDWLARRLIDSGWRIKGLHKTIVLSNAYRQSSRRSDQAEYEQSDFANRRLWRAELRRLDAEALRDSLLAASGRLDLKVGGPSFLPDISGEALEGLSMKDKAWTPSPKAEQNRRGLYMHSKRGLLPPIMTVFDFPDTTLPCGRRESTIVAPQALALWNNAFVHEQSEAMARRIESVPNGDPVALAWRFAMGRDPSDKERAASQTHLTVQTQRLGSKPRALGSLCHVLMNANEFIYVD